MRGVSAVPKGDATRLGTSAVCTHSADSSTEGEGVSTASTGRAPARCEGADSPASCPTALGSRVRRDFFREHGNTRLPGGSPRPSRTRKRPLPGPTCGPILWATRSNVVRGLEGCSEATQRQRAAHGHSNPGSIFPVTWSGVLVAARGRGLVRSPVANPVGAGGSGLPPHRQPRRSRAVRRHWRHPLTSTRWAGLRQAHHPHAGNGDAPPGNRFT